MIMGGAASGGSNAQPLDYKALLKAAEAALQEGGRSIISDFRGATATWEHKPEFVIRGPFLERRGGDSVLYIRVQPNTHIDIFTYVDRGTQPHFIFPRRKPSLVYQKDFTPKTETGSLYSRSGGKSGPWTRRRAVAHPGIEARKFTTVTAINHQPWWNTRVERLAREFCVQVYAGRVRAL
jgi:hypothetical protein